MQFDNWLHYFDNFANKINWEMSGSVIIYASFLRAKDAGQRSRTTNAVCQY